jgi:hypothetical protein
MTAAAAVSVFAASCCATRRQVTSEEDHLVKRITHTVARGKVLRTEAFEGRDLCLRTRTSGHAKNGKSPSGGGGHALSSRGRRAALSTWGPGRAQPWLAVVAGRRAAGRSLLSDESARKCAGEGFRHLKGRVVPLVVAVGGSNKAGEFDDDADAFAEVSGKARARLAN